MYFAIIIKVTLKEWSGDNDLDTIFSFHPLIEVTSHIYKPLVLLQYNRKEMKFYLSHMHLLDICVVVSGFI